MTQVSGSTTSPHSVHFGVFTGGVSGWALTNVSVYLASGLALQGHTVDLVTLAEPEKTLRNLYGRIDGFSEVRVISLGVRRARECPFALKRYLREYDPDVLFSQPTYINVVAVLATRLAGVDCKNVVIEGAAVRQNRLYHDLATRMVMRPMVRLTYRLAHGIIAKSPALEAELGQVLGQRSLSVPTCWLPNPYPLEWLRARASESAILPWENPDELPTIVSVGRLAPQKAHDILIRAVARARATTPCRLLILGEGPERSKLERLVTELDLDEFVALPGRVDNVLKYFADSAVFALISQWEGWSSSLMEAMALGLPVVVSEGVCSGTQLVRDGSNGIVVSGEDENDVADAISRLLSRPDLRKTLGLVAQQTTEAYDYRRLATAYAAFASSLPGVASNGG